MRKEVERLYNEAISLLTELSQDATIPKNVRKKALEARDKLIRGDEALDLSAVSAVVLLEDLVNDPNISAYGRTMIFTIIAKLEALAREAAQ